MYGIVVHGILITNLSETSMNDANVIKQLKTENNMKPRIIIKITSLRRKNRLTDDKVKLHHSIVVYMNNLHAANKCITNGYYVDYLHHAAEKFAPQFQITQCFNCYNYGHRATNCKRDTRCGKCGDKHNTKECESETAKCLHCEDSHEAWRSQCPAYTAEKNRLVEMMGNSPCLFN